jgi:elongation factor Ts
MLKRARELFSKRPRVVGRVFAHLHPTGRSGALVELSCGTPSLADSAEFGELLNDLALHIAAARPRYIGKEDVPPAEIQAAQARYAEETKAKPEPLARRILQNKLDEHFFPACCLLSQVFFNEAKFKGTIEQLLKQQSAMLEEEIQLTRFAWFDVDGDSAFSERARKRA